MCRMIAAEMGIGVLPEAAARRHLEPMKLTSIAITEPWAKRSLFLGVRDHGALSRAARLLVAHLCGEAAV
ncbi:MAG: LysR substrate-binding domain-containing protein, partial [Caulobacteraceae bacterium]